MKNLLFTLLMLALSSCSTGINKLAPNTYSLSETSFSTQAAESSVLSSANQFCRSLGKEVLVQTISRPDSDSYSIIFECIRRGEASRIRPSYEHAPSVVAKNVAQ